ncbi:DUF5805 domain-containing protein [Halorussus halobius]|uniref:DUF5805 domain-containing protein n=1 Tax=Halorussus halobius TaxID=1710537 RepID=UPI001091E885|nr:DUF5805 domain-containing protein [Halorussus halobius]
MTDEGDVDTSRTTVKTFVPAYQKAEWKRHADDLDMSQSEFVRTMVQAGRRDFDLEPVGGPESGGDPPASGDGDDADDGDRGFEERTLSVLSESEHRSWDDLVERLTADVEDRLDETLQRLQTENRVTYSGRHGGYAVVSGDHGD